MIGKTVGNYRILDRIGSGGMGDVYKAVHLTLDRVVAMKMIHPTLVSDQENINRFYKEAKIQAQLNHPNIVTVHDFLEIEGNYCIIMEYVHGESIGKIARENGSFEPYTALSIFRQILSGVRYAHSKGVVHRDIKPNNFILTPVVVKITDFGIAWIVGDAGFTTTGSVAGTPKYMSPEQILGEEVDHRTDIYSLGITLYEMLTGRVPFPGESESDYQVKKAHIELPPTPLTQVKSQIPKKLDEVVLKALSKKPEDRFQSVDEFMASLESTRVRRRKGAPKKGESLNATEVGTAASDAKEETPNRTPKGEEFDEGGDLSAIPYPTLLASLHREKRTGVLILDSERKLEIYFVDGLIVFVEGWSPGLTLGEMLIDKSKITRMDQEEVLSFAHDTRLRVGEALVRMGKISPHELNSALEVQMKEKLIEGFQCKNGFYGFKNTRDFTLEATYKINPMQVIYDGVNRLIKNGEIPDGSFYDMNSSITPVSNVREELARVVFSSSRELRLVALLKEGITLGEVTSGSLLGREETLRFLYFICLAGFARLKGKNSEFRDQKELEDRSASTSNDAGIPYDPDKTTVLTEQEVKELKERGYVKAFRERNFKTP